MYINVKISDALCSGSIATVDEILLDGLSRPLLNSTAPLKLRLAWVALLSEKMRGILFGKGCDPLVKRSHDLLNIRGQRQIWRWSSGRTPYFIFLICILPYFVAAHTEFVRWGYTNGPNEATGIQMAQGCLRSSFLWTVMILS